MFISSSAHEVEDERPSASHQILVSTISLHKQVIKLEFNAYTHLDVINYLRKVPLSTVELEVYLVASAIYILGV